MNVLLWTEPDVEDEECNRILSDFEFGIMSYVELLSTEIPEIYISIIKLILCLHFQALSLHVEANRGCVIFQRSY